MRRETVDECVRRNLELLREATASDCAFLVAFHPLEPVVGDVQVARSAFAQCRPEALTGTPIDAFPWLKSRMDHLRLSELRDTSAARRQGAEPAASRSCRSVRRCWLPFKVQGRPAGFLGPVPHAHPRGA